MRKAGQIGREQLQAITQLHEGFARSLTHALGAYLRVVFAATLVSAEHLTYREFLERIPETTYLASCKLEPMGVIGALQLDLKVALPIVDLLLGRRRQGHRRPPARSPRSRSRSSKAWPASSAANWRTAWQAVNLQVSLRPAAGAARRSA